MRDAQMLECRKDLFQLPDGLHYLNCAYMSPLASPVEAAGIEAIRGKRVPSDIAPADFFEPADDLRAAFARLIGGDDPNRVAIVPSVSYGIGTAAWNLDIAAGQNVVILEEQFPSNVYPWRAVERTRGAELRTVAAPPPAAGRAEAWNARVLEAIDAATAVVALPQYHWTDGTWFDLAAIGRRAREVGAALIVDGTQSVGAAPCDVADIRPDALVCAGYKWLLGPYSLGLAWFGDRFDGGVAIEDAWCNRLGSDDFRRIAEYTDELRPGALRYDVGERSNFTLLPMLQAGLDLVMELGTENIQQYCAEITEGLFAPLADRGVWSEAPDWRGAHLFGLRLPSGVRLETLQAALARDHVSVSLRGSAVRVAPHVYNDAEDIEVLRRAVLEALD